jgi:hypothetical protein
MQGNAGTSDDGSDGRDPAWLAKSLGISVEELHVFANKLGISFKNHRVEVGQVGIIKAAFKYRDLSEDQILDLLNNAEDDGAHDAI